MIEHSLLQPVFNILSGIHDLFCSKSSFRLKGELLLLPMMYKYLNEQNVIKQMSFSLGFDVYQAEARLINRFSCSNSHVHVLSVMLSSDLSRTPLISQ